MTHPHNVAQTPAQGRRDPRATRQRLLRAALDLFTSRGYHASTTPEIARRAGVAEGTIYRHFASKEELLNELYRAALRVLSDEVKAVPPTADCRGRLEAVAARWRELATRDPALIKLIFTARLGPFLDARSREAYAQLREELTRVIASGKAAGEVRTGAADLWANVWLALIVHMLEQVASKDWGPQHPAPALVIQAAWNAIQAHNERSNHQDPRSKEGPIVKNQEPN